MRLGTIVLGIAAWLCAASPHAGAPAVRIETGEVLGAEAGPAAVFRAIPYAAPPIGDLRWEPPAPARPWREPRDAKTAGPACPQKVTPGIPNLGGYFGPTSEDCLILDVTAPKGARRAPVMVWIYGGGNVAGAVNLPSYDAVNFARDGVIVVAMNYRLGALGFFAHPALTAEAPKDQPLANYGLMDQIAALKWVRRNITAFGGDPGNVTLFGESAGGEDVLQLMATPSAKGLFDKAIVQSGGGWNADASLAEAETHGAALATRLGLAGGAATAEQLRAIPAADLIAPSGEAGPVIDGRLIRLSARDAFARGAATPVPLIIGSNSNEASLMSAFGLVPAKLVANASPAMRAAYGDEAASETTFARVLFNDGVMGAPARWIAAKASARAPAWLYYFSYVPERQRLIRPGTNHASEIPFVFDSLDAVPGRTPLITPSERAEAALAHSCWVAFARAGQPDCAGGQAWPAYRPATDQLFEFGDPAGVRTHFRKAQLDAQEADAAPPVQGRRRQRLAAARGLCSLALPSPRARKDLDMTEQPRVAIIMGSRSDWPTLKRAAESLEALGVTYEARVISAHRTPQRLYAFATSARADGFKVIIAGAGGAAHLPGMAASMTELPVLGVPVSSKALNGLDSLLSIVQMPAGVPVATLAIGEAGARNAGLLAAQILALSDEALAERLAEFRLRQTQSVAETVEDA